MTHLSTLENYLFNLINQLIILRKLSIIQTFVLNKSLKVDLKNFTAYYN